MCTMIDDMTRARRNLARAAVGAALLSVSLLASGCAQPVEQDNARMSTTPEQVRQAPTQPAIRPQEAVAEKTQKSPATASKQPAQDLPAETAVSPAYAASELMGKSQAEVTTLMGAPVRVEQRAASTVWIYQGGDCGLDVFFFLDVATSDERVLTVAPTAESAAATAATLTPSAGEQATEAADPGKPPEGSVVDVCYGKLRRS